MSKQVRRSFLTRHLLVFLHRTRGKTMSRLKLTSGSVADSDVNSRRQRMPALSQDPGSAGTRPRTIRRRHRRHARCDPAERPQLGDRLRPRPRPIGLWPIEDRADVHGLLAEDDEVTSSSCSPRSPQTSATSHELDGPLLQHESGARTGLWPSDETVRRGLRQLGYAWKRPRYVLDPDPERKKKTADPPANPGPAAPERRAGPGRDRPAAVPAVAGRMVARANRRRSMSGRATPGG